MTSTQPSAARRMSRVFFSEDPMTSPVKSDETLQSTSPLESNPISASS
jgi:hypothetical protein